MRFGISEFEGQNRFGILSSSNRTMLVIKSPVPATASPTAMGKRKDTIKTRPCCQRGDTTAARIVAGKPARNVDAANLLEILARS